MALISHEVNLKAARTMNPSKDNILYRAMYQMMLKDSVNFYDHRNEIYIDQGYCINPHLYSVISYICQNESQVPFRLNKIVDKKQHRKYIRAKSMGDFAESNYHKQKSLEEIETGILADILKKPNESQTFQQYMYEKIGYRKLTGNSYVYGLNAAGFKKLKTRLYNAPSQLIEIVNGDWRSPVSGYKLRYSFDKSLELSPEEIMHMKEWNPKATYNGRVPYGLSPVAPLLKNTQRSNESLDANLSYLINGAPRGILSDGGERVMKNEIREAQQKELNQRWGTGKTKGEIMIAAGKLEWQSIGLPLTDLELLDSDEADLKAMCRVYAVPHILLSPSDSLTYNNIREAKTQVWQDNFIPDLETEIAELNSFLIPAWAEKDETDYYIDYDASCIKALHPDMDKLSLRLMKEEEGAIWSPNEIRVMLGAEEDKSNALMDQRVIKKGLTLFDADNFPQQEGVTFQNNQ